MITDLIITNTGTLTATNLIITDTIPTGATYVSGGTRNGDVVQWMIPSLAGGGGVMNVSFVVTATQPITNHDYRVRADGGFEAVGQVVVSTILTDISKKIYLPVLLK
jgi:hypothetical protein